VVGETGIVPGYAEKSLMMHTGISTEITSMTVGQTDRPKAEELYDAWYDTVFNVVHGKKYNYLTGLQLERVAEIVESWRS